MTRARISAAALRVKVIASICPGSSTVVSSLRNLRVSTEVLPEPAGASSNTDLEGSIAPARAAASRCPGDSFIGVVRVSRSFRRQMRADSADIGHVAELARARGGIDLRLAKEECAD